MKVVVAIDSLKGSLSSLDAGFAIKKGILNAYKGEEPQVIVKALADGGEGTVEALVLGMGGEYKEAIVTAPMGGTVACKYGYIESSKTAIMEMSGAAGINLVKAEKRNPLKATTYGVGEVIKDAIKNGATNFIMGIGGSVTNDCGVGMLMALGYKFLNKAGEQVEFGGGELSNIVTIDETNVIPELKDCNFKIACDVTNPLCGTNGASHVFGPQKGATKEMVLQLDDNCKSFANVVAKHTGTDHSNVSGAGAAGGLGFAFKSFINSEMQSGIDIVLKEINLEKDLIGADYVVTGEGRIDFQTSMGKAPIGVAKLAKKHGVKVIGLAGAVTEDAVECNQHGMDAFFSIINSVCTLDEAMNLENATKNMTNTTEQVFRLIKTVGLCHTTP